MKLKDKDLFGKPVRQRRNRFNIALEKYDKENFDERLTRLKWINSIFPKGYIYLLPPETAFIFDEAKMTFINGEYIATLFLTSAFIEHILSIHLQSKGFSKEAQKGLGAILECAKTNKLTHDFILEKADYLRAIRNPFAHLKSPDHSFNLTERAIKALSNPLSIIEKDAKEAISIMYTFAVTPLN
jgi:hypothetical protein